MICSAYALWEDSRQAGIFFCYKEHSTIRQWWNKSVTQTDGEICHILGLEDSITWKWLYQPMQPTDSIQFLSNY